MDGGLFINLYDEKTLALYLKYGVYGFLMPPIFKQQPSSRSKHYAALADYACAREGTHVFFFAKRKITYGGIIKGNKEIASFYLNGTTSPLGRKANAELFWDESNRYVPTETQGLFKVNEEVRAQPFMLQFDKVENMSYKTISSDELYSELAQFPYPLPSNTIQGMSFCTLTPGETDVALSLLQNSNKIFELHDDENITVGTIQTLFNASLIDERVYQNEAHLEFCLLANLQPIQHLLEEDDYIFCRQVPVCPFKPANLDRADICLYSTQNPIKDGTIPNVIIELKKDRANYHAHNQMTRYMNWLKRITNVDEFDKIIPLIIAPSFYIKKKKINLEYENKIKMYSLTDNHYYTITS